MIIPLIKGQELQKQKQLGKMEYTPCFHIIEWFQISFDFLNFSCIIIFRGWTNFGPFRCCKT